MPVTQGSTAINDLAKTLATAISSGAPTRQSVGGKDAAFSWSTGLPRGFWSFCQTVIVEGPAFTALILEPSATPVGKVAEGAAKNAAVDITPRTLALAKYAGMSTFSLERASYSDVLPQAVVATLVSGALVALEKDLATEAVTNAGSSVTGSADWTSGILSAIGTVAGNGGNPNLLAMAPADFAAAVDGPQSLQFAGTDAIPSYLGLQLHLSTGLTAGTALVMDSQALVVAESSESPVAIADPFSLASTNQIRCVVDVMAVGAVVAPGNVVSVVPTIAGATARASSSKK